MVVVTVFLVTVVVVIVFVSMIMMLGILVTMTVMIIVSMMTMTVVSWSKERLFCVVIAHVSESTILNVASQEPFLTEWLSVLLGVDSPAHHSSQEERSVVSLLDLLVQVILEELLRLAICTLHFTILILTTS